MADEIAPAMNPMLTPAVFIGVGTNGAEVIGHLQRLIYEEYLEDDLPVLQTVAIITTRSDQLYLTRVAHRHNRILLLTVPNTDAVLAAVDAGLTPAARGMRNWLPPQLRRYSGFNSGSNNIRFAGRLHLWVNYDRVVEFLQSAKDACTSGEAFNTSNAILQRKLRGGRDATYVRLGSPDVYVIGTLCGGTCSGMAADLGFTIKYRLNIPEPVAIFTIPSLADINGALATIYASNAYAAMAEMDYWYRNFQGKPDIVLPDDTSIPGTAFPYKRVCLESTATATGQSMVRRGATDLSGLNEMIALNLFLEACAGTHTFREGERNDYTQTLTSPQLLDPLERRPRAYWSFGAAMIACPKYTIALAAAARAICRKITLLLDTKTEADVNQRQTKAVVEGVSGRGGLLDQLYLRGSQENLLEIVNRECRALKLSQHTADKLSTLLGEFPADEPFRNRIADQGSFALRVATQYSNHVQPLIKQSVVDAYRGFRLLCARRHAGAAGAGTGYGLLAAKEWLETLEAQLEKVKNGLGKPQTPSIMMQAVRDKLARVSPLESDLWLAMMGVKDEALLERKSDAMETYRHAVLKAVRQLVDNKKIEALDYAITCVDELAKELQGAINRLRECYDHQTNTGKLHDRYKELMDQLETPPRNTEYLFRGAKAQADVDLEVEATGSAEVYNALFRALTGETVLNEQTVATMDRKMGDLDKTEMTDRLLQSVQPAILNRMAAINVLERVRRNWDASYYSLIAQALPHVELSADYTTNPVAYRICHETVRGEVYASGNHDQLTDLIHDRVRPAVEPLWQRWQAAVHDQADHMVIFLYEEPGISSTFIPAYKFCKREYEGQGAASREGTPVWTSREWVESNGPSLETIDWGETVRFLVDSTADIFLAPDNLAEDSEIGPAALFRFHDTVTRLNPFLAYDPRDGSTGKRVYAHREARYYQEMAAATGGGQRLAEDLRDRLRDNMLALTQERVLAMVNRVIEQELNGAGGEETDNTKKLQAYWAKMRRLVFSQDYNAEERALLAREFEWLRV